MIFEAGERDGLTFTGPKGAFHPIARFDLIPFLSALTGPYEVAVVVAVDRGVIGIGLADDENNHLPDSERVLDSSPDLQTLTLRFADRPKHLIFRNRREDVQSIFTIHRITLREAA